MARKPAWIVIAIALLAAAGCQSTVDPLTQDLTPDQYFQKAIEASDKDNYRLALRYYEAFQTKYPNDAARNTWASYEIAFLYHKLGDDEKAIQLFDQLVASYQNRAQGAPQLPPGPKVLAEKVKSNILKARKASGEPAPTAAPAGAEAPPPAAPGTTG